MEEKKHFQHIMLYFIKKDKNASEAHTQKDLCGVWRRHCDWLNVSKVVGRVLCWRFLTGWHSSQVHQWSRQQSDKDNNGEQWMLHQQETADILKIHKSSTENHLQQLGYVEVKWKSFSRVWLFATPWGFSRQEYWSGLSFPSPGDLPNPGIKPRSPAI